jgi:hypothetical protein
MHKIPAQILISKPKTPISGMYTRAGKNRKMYETTNIPAVKEAIAFFNLANISIF